MGFRLVCCHVACFAFSCRCSVVGADIARRAETRLALNKDGEGEEDKELGVEMREQAKGTYILSRSVNWGVTTNVWHFLKRRLNAIRISSELILSLNVELILAAPVKTWH